ncbi:MAG: diguanylate cyclase [Burkholderiaceae bacterium]|nr:diguanylate cyclase [Burkholderiaceae bacterium]
MRRPWQRWRQLRGTLQARLAIGGLLTLLGGMALTVWLMVGMAEHDTLAQAQRRELQDARRSAEALGRRIETMHGALAAAALGVDAEWLHEPARAGRFLEQQAVLRGLFANLFIAAPDGRMLAYVDQAGLRHPDTGLGDRDYFQRALRERRAVLSDPVPGRVSGEPVVVFVQPLLQGDRVIGALGGALRLASRDLLAEFNLPSGAASVRQVVSDGPGRMLTHDRRERLLAAVADEPALRQAHARWQAAGRPSDWADAQGLDAGDDEPAELIVTASDPLSGWRIWRLQPRAELLAPLHAARQRTLLVAAALALGLSALLLTWLHLQLRPLAQLERRAVRLLQGDADGDWPQADGEVGRLAQTLRHVWAEHRQMADFNAQVLRKLGSVMAAAPVGIAFTRNRRFELVSAEFCRLLGRSEEQLLGQPAQPVFASEADYAALGVQLGLAFARGEAYAGEVQLRHGEGWLFWASLRARAVDAQDPQAGTIWSINDISEQVASRQLLEYAALHDALTGVINRKGFERALAAEFSGQPGTRPAAVVMLDLDHFKPINDSAGHAAGDAMLKAVAQAIVSRVRATDTVARLGGDEFALLLPHCDHAYALRVADKVRDAVMALRLDWQGRPLQVGASLGVAELTPRLRDAEHWLAEADAACYEAKRSGRGQVRLARAPLSLAEG